MYEKATFARIRHLVQWLAIVIGMVTALAVPAGFGAVAWGDQVTLRQFQANLAAKRLSEYAYIQGPGWRYSKNRLAEMIGFVFQPDDESCQTILDGKGGLILSQDCQASGPRLVREAPVFMGADVVGWISISISLWPFIGNLALFLGLGVALGCSAYLCVHHFPLRALTKAIAVLDKTSGDLHNQMAATNEALLEARRQAAIAVEALHQADLANRTKSEFLANMSHELRTPLNAIIGFSDVMISEIFGPIGERHYKGYALDINHSGNHLLAIINDILDISKIEAGRMEIEHAPIDLLETLEICRRLVQVRAEEAGLSLSLELPTDMRPIVCGDEIKLKQIVLNLLSNSIKFTPAGGEIRLSAGTAADTSVFVTVTDTGVGMTPTEIELAMQPFRQVDNALARKYDGTGLGLPLCKAFAELQNGRLQVESRPGAGTAVTIFLPAVLPRAVAA